MPTIPQRLAHLKKYGQQFKGAAALTSALRGDSRLQAEVRELYLLLLKKQVSGCINCYADAFFELLSLTPERVEKAAACMFRLKPGVLLHDAVNMDSSRTMSNANITTELALYHLATNPGCASRFEVLPSGWEKQVEQYMARK